MNAGVSSIKIGRLLPGASEIGEGATRPVRGMAYTHEGEIAVIAKRLASREIAVEVMCALLGRAAGLPIPEPLLLVDESMAWHYASADVGHPNLAQYIQTNDSSVLDELERWPSLLDAACFDELIANPDRHDGNLLYDGQGFFLIDHGMCIPFGMPPATMTDDYHSNQLLDLHIGTCRDEPGRQRSAKSSAEWVLQHACGTVNEITSIPVQGIDREAQLQLVSFLKSRAEILGGLLHDRINPQLQGRLAID